MSAVCETIFASNAIIAQMHQMRSRTTAHARRNHCLAAQPQLNVSPQASDQLPNCQRSLLLVPIELPAHNDFGHTDYNRLSVEHPTADVFMEL